MELEVKIRLPNAEQYEKVRNMLGASPENTYEQENVQFDGIKSEIFYDEKCLVTYKGEGSVVDGVKITTEIEDFADYGLCRAIVDDPSKMSELKTHVAVVQTMTSHAPTAFKCLGSYSTKREVYPWEGVKIELDMTTYQFGVAYEIEIESEHPEKHRDLMVALLDKNSIEIGEIL